MFWIEQKIFFVPVVAVFFFYTRLQTIFRLINLFLLLLFSILLLPISTTLFRVPCVDNKYNLI